MAIDPVQFNRLFNALKDLVGVEGSFVLLTYKKDPLTEKEGLMTRWHGSIPNQLMLMRIGNEQHGRHISEWIEKTFSSVPRDPD